MSTITVNAIPTEADTTASRLVGEDTSHSGLILRDGFASNLWIRLDHDRLVNVARSSKCG